LKEGRRRKEQEEKGRRWHGLTRIFSDGTTFEDISNELQSKFANFHSPPLNLGYFGENMCLLLSSICLQIILLK